MGWVDVSHTRLAESWDDAIVLDGVELDAHIGVPTMERRLRQRLLCRIEIAVDISAARRNDDLAATLDYDTLLQRLRRCAATRCDALLERLGDALLAVILAEPTVRRASVTLAKPGILAGATPSVTVVGCPPRRVAIGLGGNLEEPIARLARAVDALDCLGQIEAVSSLYETEPWGVREQPVFFNAAALVRTSLLPQAILVALKRIERQLGRRPGLRWGPRAIDLDLLDDEAGGVTESELIVPHPRLFERAFALVPLAEIAPLYRPALARLSPEESTGVVRRAEWPAWGANLEPS